eukprot:CAMPEP_0171067248 /NCGR_PEP_ID=MMETSP0766_2-20121228/7891_1 /TAXON_ID=439317 /ORGANISM="Gambierdiscus australes, Strain CAWD 149" /LENGTH=475 /DNA_ID=CAMNT_0011523475 /DNA_START=186 /DNA_END=1610 /DNA_ORIENTATION=+
MIAFSLRSHGLSVPLDTTLAVEVSEAVKAAQDGHTELSLEATHVQRTFQWYQWKSYERIVVRRKDLMIISKTEMQRVQKFLEVLLKEKKAGRRHRRLGYDRAWAVDDEDVPLFHQSGESMWLEPAYITTWEQQPQVLEQSWLQTNLLQQRPSHLPRQPQNLADKPEQEQVPSCKVSRVRACAPSEMVAFSLKTHGLPVPRDRTLADLVTEVVNRALVGPTKRREKAVQLQAHYEWFKWELYIQIVVRKKDLTIISRTELEKVQKFVEVLLKERDVGQKRQRRRRLQYEAAWTVDDYLPQPSEAAELEPAYVTPPESPWPRVFVGEPEHGKRLRDDEETASLLSGPPCCSDEMVPLRSLGFGQLWAYLTNFQAVLGRLLQHTQNEGVQWTLGFSGVVHKMDQRPVREPSAVLARSLSALSACRWSLLNLRVLLLWWHLDIQVLSIYAVEASSFAAAAQTGEWAVAHLHVLVRNRPP